MSASGLAFTLLIGAATVVAAVLAARLAHSAGLPALLVFLGLGLALGESGAGIRFDNAGLAEVLGLSALVVILAEGGLTTNWAHARPAMPAALLLATVGVGISMLVVGAGARYLLGFSWRNALLLGAVLAPTDAAAVFSVLRRLPLPPALSGMLEGESGLNDPPSVLAVTLLSPAAPGRPAGSASVVGTSPWLIAGEIGWELAGGLLIGLVVGFLGVLFLRRVALPASGLYPVAVLAFVVFGYGAATLAAASGFLAVYVSAVLLGNARLPHGPATRGFAEGVGWLAQIGLFVLLGLLASPSRLPGQLLSALVVGVIVVFLARPVAVVLATAPLALPWRASARAATHSGARAVARVPSAIRRLVPSRSRERTRSRDAPAPGHGLGRVPWRQQVFLSWAGLRGAVPIVLATIPLSRHAAGSERLFDIVFVVVIAFTLLQGPTLPWLARRLRVTAPAEPLEVIVEAAPLEELHAELLQVSIPPESRLHGVEIYELRLPSTVNLALIVRAGAGFVPEPTTVLLTGDRLLIVAPAAARERTERRLRAVSRAGKLAGWFGEHGD
ncbi:MAG TPA: potassium/proton antiporter [Trebonia sp.]|jgi:cell volume regulation protein A|nr:potassium/proton antiporter [Trebonia sp.]